MQSDYRSVVRTTEKIIRADNSDDVFNLLAAYGVGFGLEYLFAGSLSMEISGSGQPPVFFMSKTPEKWEEVYLANGYLYIDPGVEYATRMTRSFRWAECYEHATQEQLRYRSEMQTLGLNYGIVFPMHHTVGCTGAVVFASKHHFDLAPMIKTQLEIVARCAFEKLESLIGRPESTNIIKLSEREREILTLVAQGKTNWEVGKILEFSEYSVRDYLKDVSRRLNTSNRTHTVTRAIQMGLISP